jgi:hypothetical protein
MDPHKMIARYDVLSWFIMVYHALTWVHHLICAFIMVDHGLLHVLSYSLF